MLTAERLRELLDYDAETGVFRWRFNSRQVKAGQIAGHKHAVGYVHISVDNRIYRAHRLAWLHTTGAWPAKEIDHVNGDKADNRLSNLREATSAENKCNTGPRRSSKLGIKGVERTPVGRFAARIIKRGRRIHLGTFLTAEEAHAAYCAAAEEHHGEFARTS